MKFSRRNRRDAAKGDPVGSLPTPEATRHELPSSPSLSQEDRTAAVEDAIVSINDTILKLTAEIERIDQLVETKPAGPEPTDR